jgi:indole-3-glycerol phosphate synthase
MNTRLARDLCTTGELRTILDDASIPALARDGLFRHVCTAEYDRDVVLSIYAFMTPEEKKELMRSFARRGYEVNFVHC